MDGSQNDEPAPSSSADKVRDLQAIIKGFAEGQRVAQLPCFMMDTPVRNEDFWGRSSVLDALDEVLLPPNKTTASKNYSEQKSAALCGIGGIGKTSIAIEYAFSRKDKFDAVFWIRADEFEKLEQAVRLGLVDATGPFDTIVCRELAKGWLQNPVKVLDQENGTLGQTEAHWLTVFDNVDSIPMLEDYWSLPSNGSILATSRDNSYPTYPPTAIHVIKVEPLIEPDAAQLLQHLSRNNKDDELALQIAAKSGGLPLAISQMAAAIRHQDLSFSDFLVQYEDDAYRREVLYRQEAQENHVSVWAVDQVQPHTRCVLDICSMLDPDCIQHCLFTDAVSGKFQPRMRCGNDDRPPSPPPPPDPEWWNVPGWEGLDSFPATRFTYRFVCASLGNCSLAHATSNSAGLRIHRRLRDILQLKMDPEKALRYFLAAVNLVLSAWGDTPVGQRYDLSLARKRDGLFPHALTLRNYYIKRYKDQDLEGLLPMAKLMSEAGWYQHERGTSQDNKPFLALALDICNKNSGPDVVPVLSDVHFAFAAHANETNNAKVCLSHTQKLLELRLDNVATTGKGDIWLAIAHNEHAIALVMNGEHQQAIKHFEDSMNVYRGLDEYWPGMDTNPRSNIGTGRVYHGLGNIAQDQGLLEESEGWHQKALAHYQETLGNNHHKTADLCSLVAKHCLRKNKTDSARTLIDQALKIYGLREEAYLPEMARATFLKARLEMQLWNEDETTSLFKLAKSLRTRLTGVSDNPDHVLREADFDELVMFLSR